MNLMCITGLVVVVFVGYLVDISNGFPKSELEVASTVDHPRERRLIEDGVSGSIRSKRSSYNFYNMMNCATGCHPTLYRGYGCYCGFLGSGVPVDGIDQCCKDHDLCYVYSNECRGFSHYLIPYNWKCEGEESYCETSNGHTSVVSRCGAQLCECDRQFTECVNHYACPDALRKPECPTSFQFTW